MAQEEKTSLQFFILLGGIDRRTKKAGGKTRRQQRPDGLSLFSVSIARSLPRLRRQSGITYLYLPVAACQTFIHPIGL